MSKDIRSVLSGARQLILVKAADMDTPVAGMQLLERIGAGKDWDQKATFPVSIGKNGLAWGVGLHDFSDKTSPQKQEGDHKAPQGLFSLGTAFGTANEAAFKWPYMRAHESLVCVDDPHSAYYNTFADIRLPAPADWKSYENMKREDGLYKWGLVIRHNCSNPIQGMGSCIFMHIWRGNGIGTEGCTAMSEENILLLLSWLVPMANPLLLQGSASWVDGLEIA